MKKSISLVIAMSLVLTTLWLSGPTGSAQKSSKAPPKEDDRETKGLKKNWDKLPDEAKRAVSPEVKAVWDKLTPKQREKIKTKVHQLIHDQQQKGETENRDVNKNGTNVSSEDEILNFNDKDGKPRVMKGKQRDGKVRRQQNKSARLPVANKTVTSAKLHHASQLPWDENWASSQVRSPFRKASFVKPSRSLPDDGADADNDGLPDSFENVLADSFTPIYHVSQYETDNYSTFEDFVPWTVKDRYGPNPVSHFRVVPLWNPIRFNPYSGRLESFLRIDYLTLWDHDSGLVGTLCDLAPGEGLLEGTNEHELDGERSALLVSAPVADPDNPSINFDPSAYSVLSIFTAAHELTAVDHSMYHDLPFSPAPVDTHINLWQALSKHSTYTFDPDFYPILQVYQTVIIFTVVYAVFFRKFCGDGFYDSFWDDCFDPSLDWSWGCEDWFYLYLVVIYYIVILVFTCVVERFYEQGGTFANLRINIGEPISLNPSGMIGNPINGSGFIEDDSPRAFHMLDRLIEPLQFESLIQ
jgi:hypothetical protein